MPIVIIESFFIAGDILRINNDLKIVTDIISQKVQKTKKIKGKKNSIKLGYVENEGVRYLKIQYKDDQILIKIKDGNVDLDVISSFNYELEGLRKALENSGWKVGHIENHLKK